MINNSSAFISENLWGRYHSLELNNCYFFDNYFPNIKLDSLDRVRLGGKTIIDPALLSNIKNLELKFCPYINSFEVMKEFDSISIGYLNKWTNEKTICPLNCARKEEDKNIWDNFTKIPKDYKIHSEGKSVKIWDRHIDEKNFLSLIESHYATVETGYEGIRHFHSYLLQDWRVRLAKK